MLSLPPLLFHLPLFVPLSMRRMYDGAGYTAGNWTRRSVQFPESKQGAWEKKKKKTERLYPRTVSVCLIDCHPHTLTHTHTHTHLFMLTFFAHSQKHVRVLRQAFVTKTLFLAHKIILTNQRGGAISAWLRWVKMDAAVWASRHTIVEVKCGWVVSAEGWEIKGRRITGVRINRFLESTSPAPVIIRPPHTFWCASKARSLCSTRGNKH